MWKRLSTYPDEANVPAGSSVLVAGPSAGGCLDAAVTSSPVFSVNGGRKVLVANRENPVGASLVYVRPTDVTGLPPVKRSGNADD